VLVMVGLLRSQGNAERLFDHDKKYWGNGSMEAIYFSCGDLSPPLTCSPADPTGGPYVLADMEHMQGMMAGPLPPTPLAASDFVLGEYALSEPVWCTAAAMVPQTLYLMPSSCFEQFSNLPLKLPQRWSKDGRATWRSRPVSLAHMGDAHGPIPELRTIYDGARPAGYEVMKKEGGVVLGIGGDNSPYGAGVFYEGAITSGFSTNSADTAVMANVVAAMYGGT
jgi:hypothetical protein